MRVSNRIRYPGSPHSKRWILAVCQFWYAAKRTVKLKGIDGGPHKRRNMWFNSMIREEPYPGLNWTGIAQRRASLRTCPEVLHGCRQLVP